MPELFDFAATLKHETVTNAPGKEAMELAQSLCLMEIPNDGKTRAWHYAQEIQPYIAASARQLAEKDAEIKRLRLYDESDPFGRGKRSAERAIAAKDVRIKATDITRDMLGRTIDAQDALIEKLEKATQNYFIRYMQDEADSAENCVGECQHEDAKSVAEALAAVKTHREGE